MRRLSSGRHCRSQSWRKKNRGQCGTASNRPSGEKSFLPKFPIFPACGFHFHGYFSGYFHTNLIIFSRPYSHILSRMRKIWIRKLGKNFSIKKTEKNNLAYLVTILPISSENLGYALLPCNCAPIVRRKIRYLTFRSQNAFLRIKKIKFP